MNKTLLEISQIILSSMDSDEVNSISDSIESQQLGLILESVFYDIATDLDLPQFETLLELNASLDTSKPCLMTVPTSTARVSWIKYDNAEVRDSYKDYKDVCFLPFREFIEKQLALREETADVGEMAVTLNGETHSVLFRTDRHPQYYTTVNQNQLLFDAYKSDVDSTLQKSKTMAMGWVYPLWQMEDDFIPPLEPQQFSYFINRAKTRAFNEIKQQANAESAQESRRQKIVLQKRKTTVNKGPAIFRAPRYGR